MIVIQSWMGYRSGSRLRRRHPGGTPATQCRAGCHKRPPRPPPLATTRTGRADERAGRTSGPDGTPYPGAVRTAERRIWRAPRTWREAWTDAQYGPAGFYRREAPVDHFRTSVHASELFADAVLELLRLVDGALGQPPRLALVDVGAGRGELLHAVWAHADATLRDRLRPVAVEIADRPAGLPPQIGWCAEVPPVEGLLLANEWLDDVPLDVVVRTPEGLRLVLVAGNGDEFVGDAPDPADLAWLAQWWPSATTTDPGTTTVDPGTTTVDPGTTTVDPGSARAELGRSRDQAWAAAVRQVQRGLAVAVDYAHDRSARPPDGTLVGYRGGRVVAPVPDGTANLTAHVALDACAAAGASAGAPHTLLPTQRAALHALGVTGRRPPIELARSAPPAYLRGLVRAGAAAELTDPAGLGGFCWLVQAVGVALTWPH